MMYKPRRATARWMEGAPAGILVCFDHGDKFADRYTVFFTAEHAINVQRDGTIRQGCDQYHNTWIHGIGTSRNGHISGTLEMTAHDVSGYRHVNKHRQCRWLDLPAETRAFVEGFIGHA